MELSGLAFSLVSNHLFQQAEPEPTGIGQLGISPVNLIFQGVAFIILMILLWRFAYKPIIATLDKRRQLAAEIVEANQKAREDLSQAEDRTKATLDEARRQAQEIINQAKAIQDRTVAEASDRAREQAEQIIEQARAQINLERDQAINQLRREFADLAVLAASRVVRQELQTSPELRNKLISETLAELNTNSNK